MKVKVWIQCCQSTIWGESRHCKRLSCPTHLSFHLFGSNYFNQTSDHVGWKGSELKVWRQLAVCRQLGECHSRGLSSNVFIIPLSINSYFLWSDMGSLIPEKISLPWIPMIFIYDELFSRLVSPFDLNRQQTSYKNERTQEISCGSNWRNGRIGSCLCWGGKSFGICLIILIIAIHCRCPGRRWRYLSLTKRGPRRDNRR